MITKEEFEKLWPHPMEEYFQESVIGYYADGSQYDYRYGVKWAGDMQSLLNKASLYGWQSSFDDSTKVVKIEKHFDNGMYRIATYTPFDAEHLDISFHHDS